MTERPEDDDTVCPRCAVGCRLAPGGGRAVGRAGPANPEGRLCQKGIRAFESVPERERLTHPLVRRDGHLEVASWDGALGRLVDGVESTIASHGADALAFLGAPRSTNEANYLLGKLARTLGTNNVDNRARLCHAEVSRALTERVGWAATTAGLPDLRAADVILVVGANPAERQPVAFNSHVRPAVADGATLVHVDPVGNRTTRLADEHLAPRPGTDGLLLDALCATILEAGDHDDAFVRNRTAGFEKFVEGVSAIDRDRALDAVGVDDATVSRLADRLGTADGVAAVVGTGIEGGDGRTAESLLNLLLLTGNLGRSGAGLFVCRGLTNEQGAIDAGCVPDRLPGHQPVTDDDARARVAEVWGVEAPPTPGGTAEELLEQFGDGVRTALVVGENPAVSKRDSDWLAGRLDALDTLAVAELTHSGTTRHADVVFPAATGLETRGTVTNLDRQVQPRAPVREPPDGVRSDFEILRAIGRRSVGAAFEYDDPTAVFEEFASVAPTHRGMAVPDAGGERWPPDAGAALYRRRFETGDGLASFATPRPSVDSTDDGRLRLVVGGRATDERPARESERSVRLHPGDAASRGIPEGCRIRVGADDVAVTGVAELDGSVRSGTVFLRAVLADPLVRAGVTAVCVAPASESAR